MSTTPSLVAERFSTPQQAAQTAPYSSPVIFWTLDSFDDDEAMHREIDYLLDKDVAGRLCHTIEFVHDGYGIESRRHFTYQVTTDCYNGYIDQDEDGPYRDTGPIVEVVSVPVRPGVTLGDFVGLVADAVREIDNNVFFKN